MKQVAYPPTQVPGSRLQVQVSIGGSLLWREPPRAPSLVLYLPLTYPPSCPYCSRCIRRSVARPSLLLSPAYCAFPSIHTKPSNTVLSPPCVGPPSETADNVTESSVNVTVCGGKTFTNTGYLLITTEVNSIYHWYFARHLFQYFYRKNNNK